MPAPTGSKPTEGAKAGVLSGRPHAQNQQVQTCLEPKPSDSQDSHRAHHTKKDKIRHKIRALFKAFHIEGSKEQTGRGGRRWRPGPHTSDGLNSSPGIGFWKVSEGKLHLFEIIKVTTVSWVSTAAYGVGSELSYSHIIRVNSHSKSTNRDY